MDAADSAAAIDPFLKDHFPDLVPSVPNITERLVTLDITNPYAVHGSVQHAKLGHSEETAMGRFDSEVNGLLKFKRKVTDIGKDLQVRAQLPNAGRSNYARTQNAVRSTLPPAAQVSWLPPDFGRGFKLAKPEEELLRFCTHRAFFLSQLLN